MKSIKKVRNVQKIDLGYLLKDIHLTYRVLLEKTGKTAINMTNETGEMTSQEAFTFLKLTIETLEKGVK